MSGKWDQGLREIFREDCERRKKRPKQSDMFGNFSDEWSNKERIEKGIA